MKSARMVESFAWQMGTDAREANQVEFRLKNPARPANWYTAQLSLKDGNSLRKDWWPLVDGDWRSEEHTSELQSLMRISYAVFCLKKKTTQLLQKIHHPDHLTYS